MCRVQFGASYQESPLNTSIRPSPLISAAPAASNGDRSENGDYIYGKKKLRELDKRLHYLLKRIDELEVVDPTTISSDTVRFGATVTFLNEEDREKTYTIVGVDEINLEKHHISWRSPIAKALLGSKNGDLVTVNTPKGSEELEILKIEYLEVCD